MKTKRVTHSAQNLASQEAKLNFHNANQHEQIKVEQENETIPSFKIEPEEIVGV